MNTERVNFGNKLKTEREAKSLSLDELARVTKIPAKSLERLEAGRFEELPADVFVRGFVRSYARSVGLDAEETLRHYGELTRSERPKKELSLARSNADRDADFEGRGLGGTPDRRASTAASSSKLLAARPAGEPEGAAAKRPGSPTEELSAIAKALSDAGRSTRRMSLTLAVIILVIVATLTLSLLLRRPSHIGDGVSSVASPEVTERA